MRNKISLAACLFASFLFPTLLRSQPLQQVHPAPDCQFFFTLTAAGSLPLANGFDNRQQGCTTWSMSYVNSGFSGLTVTVQSAPNNNGNAGSWVAGFPIQETTVSGSNAATSATGGFWWVQGTNAFVRVTLSGLTGSGVVNGAVFGWRIPNAAGSSVGAITCLSGDVAAGSGGSCVTATVQGIESVPFCTGYTPTNGEFVQYTTGGSPSPCYSAAAATATGTAGGDLSGSYPNPTVASISNVVNPALQANTTVNCTNALGEFEVCSTVSTTPRGISSVEYQAGTASARFSGYKARGTQASPTTVVTGDFLTRWSGFGYDGANFIESSSIVGSAQGTVAATRVPGQIDFATGTNATPSVLTTAMSILDTQVVNFTNNITIASATPFVTVNGTTCNLQGSCSPAGASVAWNAITNPTGNLSLAMTADTTVWTWGATTGSGVNLFTLTDTASNTGTGLLQHITTASGSAASPWGADANGIGFTVNSSGNLVSISTAKETIGTALGLGTSQTAYLTLQNTTASLSSGATVQVSPSVLWSGTAYQTTAAQSQTLQFQAYVLPATGSSLTGSWVLQASINGGAFANVISAAPTGTTTFSGTVVTFIVTAGNNDTLSLQNSGFSTITGGGLAVNMATGTVSNTSGADVGVKIQPTINQASGTGSYTAFDVAPIVTAQGSGTQILQAWHAGAAGTTLEASMSFGGVLTDAGGIYTAAAPTVAASQIGFGSTVTANTNCGTVGTGCVVINVAGTTRYITYY